MFCFYYRYLIHRKMDRLEKTNSSKLSHHLCRCTACREYDARMARLGIQMKDSVCGQLSEAGIRQIETSILKTLDAFDAKKQSAPVRTKQWLSYAVAACFMIIAGLSGWFYWNHHRNIETAAAANKAIASLSDNVSFLTLLAEQPVRQEMTEWVDDAHKAVVFITNCIPQGPSNMGMISGEAQSN